MVSKIEKESKFLERRKLFSAARDCKRFIVVRIFGQSCVVG